MENFSDFVLSKLVYGIDDIKKVPYETSLINFDLMTESDMEMLVRYHDKCRETSQLARDLGRTEVADWIDLRIEEGEAQQAAKNKVRYKTSFIFDGGQKALSRYEWRKQCL